MTCEHYWVRRREGRVCIHCGKVELGVMELERDCEWDKSLREANPCEPPDSV